MRSAAFAAGLLLAAAGIAAMAGPPQDPGLRREFRNAHFTIVFDEAGVAALGPAAPGAAPNLLRAGRSLGHVVARYRMNDQPWLDFDTRDLASTLTVKSGGGSPPQERLLVYNGAGWYDYQAELELTERFRADGDRLVWTIHFRNITDKPVEISDLALVLPFAAGPDGGAAAAEPYVLDAVLTGRSARLEWRASGGTGPRLAMVPLDRCPLFEPAQTERNFAPAGLELGEWTDGDYIVYIHSRGRAGADRSGRPATDHVLTPKFTPGDEITYGFAFFWAGTGAAAAVPPGRPSR